MSQADYERGRAAAHSYHTIPRCKKVIGYVAGALMGVPHIETLRSVYEHVAGILAMHGIQPFLPHERFDPTTNVQATSIEVFQGDLGALGEADLLVAYIGWPSLGVGAEIALALASEKHVIAFHEAGRPVSRFILGMLTSSNSADVVQFRDLLDLSDKLSSILTDWQASHSR